MEMAGLLDENKSSSWCKKCEAFSQLAAAVHPASIHRIQRYPTCPKISHTVCLQRLQKWGFWRATMASPWVSPLFEASRSAYPSFEKIGSQFQNHLQLEWSNSGTWMRISGFPVRLISAIFIYITLPMRMMLAIWQDVNRAGIWECHQQIRTMRITEGVYIKKRTIKTGT